MKPKSINAYELSNWKMSCDTKEKKPRKVIQDGFIKQWVGIGWVEERKAKKKDYQKYPEVK